MSSTLPISESFILTAFGVVTGFVGATLTYCLKSRCSEIRCCCVYCKREVLAASELDNATIEIPQSAMRLQQPIV